MKLWTSKMERTGFWNYVFLHFWGQLDDDLMFVYCKDESLCWEPPNTTRHSTRPIPSWTTSVFSSTVTDLVLILRVGHFFRFRCPLVNTPQLNTQSRLQCDWLLQMTSRLRRKDLRHGDCGEIGGMKIGRVNRSTRRKPAPPPLCPPQNPRWLDPGLNPPCRGS
jgi:hypothetical protein